MKSFRIASGPRTSNGSQLCNMTDDAGRAGNVSKRYKEGKWLGGGGAGALRKPSKTHGARCCSTHVQAVDSKDALRLSQESMWLVGAEHLGFPWCGISAQRQQTIILVMGTESKITQHN